MYILKKQHKKPKKRRGKKKKKSFHSPLDIGTHDGVFANFEVFGLLCVLRGEQIADVFVVNLHVADIDFVRDVVVRVGCDSIQKKKKKKKRKK